MKVAATCTEDDISDVVARLLATGYVEHNGALQRLRRRGETITLRFLFDDDGASLQNHVQIVRRTDGVCEIFAHVEPAMRWTLGDAIKHCTSAIAGRADYERGSQMLHEAIREACAAFGDDDNQQERTA
jgi:hypothetical protein